MPERKEKSKVSFKNNLRSLRYKWKEDKEFAELLLDTVREGLLVLDEDLRVGLGNESFYHFFKVEPEETEGKLLYELGNGQWDIPELRRLLEEILPESNTVEDYEIEHDFEEIGRRVLLLNARRIDHMQLILLAMEDVTERKEALRELKKVNNTLEERVYERTRQIRKLVSRLAKSEQKERRRISHILHDDLQQILYAAQMNLKFGFREADPAQHENLVQCVEESVNMLDLAIEKTRQLTTDLNPFVLKSRQLTDILKWLTDRFNEMHGLKTELKIKDDVLIPDEEIRAMLLQIMRELLFNVVKHAGTDHAIIRVDSSADNYLVMEVIDEGSGFDIDKKGSRIVNTKGFGLFNIRERLNLFGGNMEIDSVPNKGTHTTIQIPL